MTLPDHQAGFIAAGLALCYGCVPGVVAKTCPAGSVNDEMHEFGYAHYGAPTGLCTGVSTGAPPSDQVRGEVSGT
jgi:hypothetical protein